MKEKKSIKQKREERKRHALRVVLDEDGGTQHFWDALLINSIDEASNNANKLSKRIFWLNMILVIIGTLALFIAGYEIFLK